MAQLITQIPFWAKWDGERLKKKENEVGSREFARGWRQRALSDEEALFREEYVRKCIDPTLSMIHMDQTPIRDKIAKSHNCYMGVDLAIAKTSATAKAKGDYFVITTVVCPPDGSFKRIANIYRNRGLSFNDQINTIIRYGNYFKPKLLLVENNAYQEALVQELSRVSDLPVQAFTTHAVNKTDMSDGLPRLALDFEKSKIQIPMKDEYSREMSNVLINELISYPIAVHDDTIMSLWFATKAYTLSWQIVEKRIFVV